MYKNLVDVFQKNSMISAKGITIILDEENERLISYKDLYNKSLYVLGELQRKGIKPNEELIIQIDDDEMFLYVVWACIMGGIIAIPVAIAKNDEHRLKLLKIWNILNKPKLISIQNNLDLMKDFIIKTDKGMIDNFINNSFLIDEAVDGHEQGIPSTDLGLDDIAFLQFSSGSTGDPKGVIISHNNILINLEAIIERLEIGDCDRSLSWMPLTHDMGMILFHLVSTAAAINHYLMPTPLFIRNPVLWLKKANEHKITQLYSPNFGYKHFLNFFNTADGKDWDLSNVRMIINGAEPISVKLCNEFLSLMARYGLKSSAMNASYGMAEATVGISCPRIHEEMTEVIVDRNSIGFGQTVKYINPDDVNNCISFLEEGYPLNNCYVRICDENDKVLDESIVGHIQISGGNITPGYYNDPEATSKIKTDDGWLKTGDLGFIREGRLVVTGREKDIIIINGQNYYSHDIERVAEGICGFELGKVAVCSVFNEKVQREEIILFVLYEDKMADFSKMARDIKKHVNTLFGLILEQVIPVKNIPRTESRKIQRYKLGEMYRSGVFDSVIKELDQLKDSSSNTAVDCCPITQTVSELQGIFEEILGGNSIGINENFIEYGGDSMKMAQIYTRLERLYPGILKISDIYAYPTISKLAGYINRGNEVSLSKLMLPDDYYSNNQAVDKGFSFGFTIQGYLFEQLKLISINENIEVYDILLSMYIYLLSKITGQKALTVYTEARHESCVQSLDSDLNVTSDFLEFFRIIYRDRCDLVKKPFYSMQDLMNVKLDHDMSQITPLFCKKAFIDKNTILYDVFNFILVLAEQDRETSFVFECSQKNINKDKIKEFLNEYSRLINGIIRNYD